MTQANTCGSPSPNPRRTRRRVRGVALLGLAICIVGLTVFTWRHSVAPQAVTEPIVLAKKKAFGYVHPGDILKHKDSIRNEWPDTLTIKSIHTDCGCIGTTLPKTVLSPGEEVPLEIVLQTKQYPGDSYNRVVLSGLAGNMPITFIYELSSKGRDVIVFPSRSPAITLPDATVGDLPRTHVYQLTRGQYPLGFDKVTCSSESPELGISLSRVNEDEWTLTVVQHATDTYGSVRSYIDFSFFREGKELPYRVRKAIHGEVRGPIATMPTSILYGVVSPGEHIKSA